MGRLLSVTKPQSRPTLSQRSIESIIWRDGWLYSSPLSKKKRCVLCVCGASLKSQESFRFFPFSLFFIKEERGGSISNRQWFFCVYPASSTFSSVWLFDWATGVPGPSQSVRERENRCRLFVKKGTVQLFDTLQKTLSPHLHFFSPPIHRLRVYLKSFFQLFSSGCVI